MEGLIVGLGFMFLYTFIYEYFYCSILKNPELPPRNIAMKTNYFLDKDT